MLDMNIYLSVKYLHVACVAISGLGFLLRGLWMLKDAPLLQRRWVRILPHVNDTLLLAAAIALCLIGGQYPLVQGWLTAKLFGLVAYIILGAIALRRGRDKKVRTAAALAAVLVYGYIVAVAISKDALL